jgi:hypothetical protein
MIKIQAPAYTGILLTPVYIPTDDISNPEKRVTAILTGFKKRYAALLEFYGVDPSRPDTDFRLALALAGAHVPGFRVDGPLPKKRGRTGPKLEWTAIRLIGVLNDVDALTRAKHTSALNACRLLCTLPKYKTRYGGMKHRSLYTVYQEVARFRPRTPLKDLLASGSKMPERHGVLENAFADGVFAAIRRRRRNFVVRN